MGVLLQLVSPVERIHGMFLTGGGMFGVAAAGGVVRFLEEHKVGFDWGTPDLRIPIVVTGAIDDLALGDPRIRPDADAAYKACAAATSGSVVEGNVGAGAGATVGKMHRARGYSGMKGGIGSASVRIGDVVIGALAVVNAAGDVLDWRTGRIVAGARRPDGTFADSVDVMQAMLTGPAGAAVQDPVLGSTTIVIVATNVDLSKPLLAKVASMANCGGARAIRPYHTTGDGDQLFALSTRKIQRPDLQVTVIGALAADVVADAIVRGVRAAKSVPGWPGLGAM
jgi:L-aminopeptidase/D-esterase-like protein